MKPAIKIGLVTLGVGTAVLGACEMSTANEGPASPSSDRGRYSEKGMQSFAHERSEGASSTGRPAIGGGPLLEVRPITAAEAMWNIAGARCDHELVCNRIGSGGKFETRAECVAALQKDKGSDFTAQSCPDGVSESGLEACLRAIGEEGCGKGPHIVRENACLADKFCSAPAPGTAPGGSGAGVSGG
jgi:hypothetical protein